MSDEKPIRILVAEDHKIVREGLIANLSRQRMQVIGEARNGEEAIALYRQGLPDITLMDLRMPRMDGLTAIRAILKEFPAARIIVLTSFDGEEQNSLQSGAKAVVLKDVPISQLIETILKIHAATQ